MILDERRLTVNRTTQKVLGCAYTVSNALGIGFMEKVYENALAHEVRKSGLACEQQFPIQVKYDGIIAGAFAADLFVESAVLVELKAVRELEDVYTVQCMNYLRATDIKVWLLLNFGKSKLQVKRIVNRF